MSKKTETQATEDLFANGEMMDRALETREAEEPENADEEDETIGEEDETESAADADTTDEQHDAKEGQKSAIQQLKDFVDEDEEHSFKFTFDDFKALVGGDGLSHVIAKNRFFIFVVVFFTCCYVTTRYMMQSAMLENDALTDTLIDRRYKALTLSSELLEHTLSSQIESSLTDSTIHMPSEQAFSLKAE